MLVFGKRDLSIFCYVWLVETYGCKLSMSVFGHLQVILLSLAAVNIKTAEIYRASFQDRGPEEELRAARALTGGPVSPESRCGKGLREERAS